MPITTYPIPAEGETEPKAQWYEALNSNAFALHYYGGNLYVFMMSEVGVGPETDYNIHIFKSTDRGATWTELGSPKHTDYEAYATQRVGDVVYLTASDFAYYFVFRFDLATESWLADSAAGPEVNWTAGSNKTLVKLAARSDGSVVLFYPGPEEYVSSSNRYRVYWCTWSAESGWSSSAVLSSAMMGTNINWFIEAAVTDENDIAHAFIYGYEPAADSLYHCALGTDGVSGDFQALVHPNAATGSLVQRHVTQGIGCGIPDARGSSIAISVASRASLNDLESRTRPAQLDVFVGTAELNPEWTATTVDSSMPVYVSWPYTIWHNSCVKFDSSGKLHVFWAEDTATGADPLAYVIRESNDSGGSFSDAETLFSAPEANLVPVGYPAVVGSEVGLFFATIDIDLYFSMATKYEALKMGYLSIATAAAAAVFAYFGSPSSGAVTGRNRGWFA